MWMADKRLTFQTVLIGDMVDVPNNKIFSTSHGTSTICLLKICLEVRPVAVNEVVAALTK